MSDCPTCVILAFPNYTYESDITVTLPLSCSPQKHLQCCNNLFPLQDYIEDVYKGELVQGLEHNKCLQTETNGFPRSKQKRCSDTRRFICKAPSSVQSNLCKSIISDLCIDMNGGYHKNDGGMTMTMKKNNQINYKTNIMTMMLMMPVTITTISGN